VKSALDYANQREANKHWWGKCLKSIWHEVEDPRNKGTKKSDFTRNVEKAWEASCMSQWALAACILNIPGIQVKGSSSYAVQPLEICLKAISSPKKIMLMLMPIYGVHFSEDISNMVPTRELNWVHIPRGRILHSCAHTHILETNLYKYFVMPHAPQ